MAGIPALDWLFDPSPGEEDRRRRVAQMELLRKQQREPPQGPAIPGIVPPELALAPSINNPPPEPIPTDRLPQPGLPMPELGQPPQAPPIPIPNVYGRQGGGGLPQAAGRGTGTGGGGAAPGGAAAAPAGAVPPPTAPAAAAGPAPGSPEARILELERLRDEATKPPDMASAQEAYGRQQQEGQHQLALAMMAQEAKMQPFAAQHLKQAAAAGEPMKMVGGTMTKTGFIEDPGFKQQQTITRLEGQIAQQQRIQASNAARADKIEAAEKEHAFRRELSNAQIKSHELIAGMVQAGKEGKKGGKAGTPAEINPLLDEAERLLPGATSGTIQRLGTDVAANLGISTSGAKATAALDTVAGQLVSKMPRMEGPQSDKDRELYERMAGRLADPNVPVATRQAALAQLRRMNQQYATDPYGGQGGGGGRRSTDRAGGEVDFSSLPP